MKDLKKIKSVLEALEKKSDENAKKSASIKIRLKEGKEQLSLSALVESHFKLQEQIDSLSDAMSVLQDQKESIDNEIFDQVDKLKNKSIKFGNILVKIQTVIERVPAKTTYSYKSILEAITDAYEFEKGFIARLMKKWSRTHKGKEIENSDLIITKEARQLIKQIEGRTGKKIALKEDVLSTIKDWAGQFLNFIKRGANIFSNKVDKIEQLANELQ